MIQVARWSEAAGCEAILVGTDNGLVDPWATAQLIIENTDRICPLVAVQPLYMHPFWVAKRIATMAYLYGRRVWVNLVAGGFKNDLIGLGDETPHDLRYDRIAEYAKVIRLLLESDKPASFEGRFYQIKNLRMSPSLEPALRPGWTLSGSSSAAIETARSLGALLIQYPLPAHLYDTKPLPTGLDLGIRIGILAKDDAHEAWTLARDRFPSDRRGQLAHRMAEQGSDAVWHQQLCELSRHPGGEDDPYWLLPFENYHEYCPFLVGTHDRVAAEIARYRTAGYGTLLMAVPDGPEDLEHVAVVLDRAVSLGEAPDAMKVPA